MLISFVIIILRNGRAIFQEAIAQGLTGPLALGLCSVFLTTAFPDILTLLWENNFLKDRSLRHRSLLIIWEVQTLLRPFAQVEAPGSSCLWKAGSLVLARALSSLLWPDLLPMIFLSLKWYQMCMGFLIQLPGGSGATDQKLPGGTFNMSAVMGNHTVWYELEINPRKEMNWVTLI